MSHYTDMAHVAVPYNARCHSQAPSSTQQALHDVAPPKHSPRWQTIQGTSMPHGILHRTQAHASLSNDYVCVPVHAAATAGCAAAAALLAASSQRSLQLLCLPLEHLIGGGVCQQRGHQCLHLPVLVELQGTGAAQHGSAAAQTKQLAEQAACTAGVVMLPSVNGAEYRPCIWVWLLLVSLECRRWCA